MRQSMLQSWCACAVFLLPAGAPRPHWVRGGLWPAPDLYAAHCLLSTSPRALARDYCLLHRPESWRVETVVDMNRPCLQNAALRCRTRGGAGSASQNATCRQAPGRTSGLTPLAPGSYLLYALPLTTAEDGRSRPRESHPVQACRCCSRGTRSDSPERLPSDPFFASAGAGPDYTPDSPG